MTIGDSLDKHILSEEEKELRPFLEKYHIPQVSDLSSFPLVRDKKHLFSYAYAKKKLIIPLEEKGEKLLLAMANPKDFETLEEVRFLTGREIEEVFVPKMRLEEAIELCFHQEAGEASEVLANMKREDSSILGEDEESYDLLNQSGDSTIIKLLNVILVEAIQQGASDIHFEPTEKELVVRYRIDGVLQFRHSPPPELQSQLLTRIKVMAKLDIAQQRLPQDGRIKLAMGGRQIDFRVSTVPIVYGERIVLRILDKGNILLGYEKLGMEQSTLSSFRKLTSHNQGIVLVTGPTGSGKTTTLYSAISELSKPEVNVMTIEDPVEYKLNQIAQIGVNHKIDLTFARGLRHILRQDPDIILIGEIRDKETAEIAIQASLTGHLVLSTLHTNDAPSAITRLVDMGIEPYLLSSSILGVLAQRLLRKICESCKESYTPTDEELVELGVEREYLHEGKLFKGRGCSQCYDLGYKGRIGVYELLKVSQAFKMQLLKSADSTELQRVALAEGMQSLREEGKRLCLEGKTSLAEVLRVTRHMEV